MLISLIVKSVNINSERFSNDFRKLILVESKECCTKDPPPLNPAEKSHDLIFKG